MGALTDPVWFRDTRVVSGDVIHFEPAGFWAWLRRPFAAVVDTRDRSIPYLVLERRLRVLKVPLEGAPYPEARYRATVYRLPGVDKARAAQIAACAAERPGEGIHHPDFDCGRVSERPGDVVREAFAAIGVSVDLDPRQRPGAPLCEVRGPQDPPNEVIVADSDATHGGDAWLRRGIPRTLPWQRRGRR